MIIERVLGLLRKHWPQTHIVLRGDGHFANPELMELMLADGNADFIFGLGGNAVQPTTSAPLRPPRRHCRAGLFCG